MKLTTKEIIAKLAENGAASAADPETSHDHEPVVKIFCPWGSATWLITESTPDDPDMLFGLCDLGHGEPELGYVSLDELQSLRGPGGLTLERDLYFTPDKGILAYAEAAREARRIVA